MLAGFTVPELNRYGKCLDDRAVQFPNLLGLFPEQGFLLIHNVIEPYHIADPSADKEGNDWFSDNIHNAQLIPSVHYFLRVLCS